jgi:hypothetical protein
MKSSALAPLRVSTSSRSNSRKCSTDKKQVSEELQGSSLYRPLLANPMVPKLETTTVAPASLYMLPLRWVRVTSLGHPETENRSNSLLLVETLLVITSTRR